MSENYQIDSVDRKILAFLKEDARMPYTEIAKKLIVSGGTIHQRVNKMTEAGIIKGSKVVIDYKELGFDVTTLLGIHLKSAKDQNSVVAQLETFNEVTEVYYTTGTYALIVKVQTKTIKHFHEFLITKLQAIKEVQSTESFICLDQPIHRDIEIT